MNTVVSKVYLMSELRNFLRYEISGLLIFIETIIFFVPFYIFGSDTAVNDLSKFTVAAPILAFPVGWIVYQYYDWSQKYKDPHTSFKIVKNYWEKALRENALKGEEKSNNFYKALVDYILTEDMYEHDQGLADTIRGFWDHYDSKCVVGLFVLPISIAFSAIVLLLIPSHFITSLMQLSLSVALYMIALIILLFIHIMIYESKNKIREQVIWQESILIYNNLYKLSRDKEMLKKILSYEHLLLDR